MSSGSTPGVPLKMDWFSEFDEVLVGEAETSYVLIRVTAPESLEVQLRHPLNLCMVIDQSSSMRGRSMRKVRQAAKVLVDRLKPEDRISLVAFDHSARTMIEPVNVVDKDSLSDAIDELDATGGWTNLSAGLKKGIDILSAETGDDDFKRIILLTDGQANWGKRTRKDLSKLVLDARREFGVSTTAIGVGLDFNEDLLHAVALSGAGEFYYVEEANEAPAVFEEELFSLQSLAVRRVSVSIETTGNVTSFHQLTRHFENFHTKREALIEVGNIRLGESRDLLLAFDLRRFPREQNVNVARLQLAFEPIQGDPGQATKLSVELTTRAVVSDGCERLPEPAVTKAVLLQGSAQVRRHAIRDTDRGDHESAIERLEDYADVLEGLPEESRDDQLTAEIGVLRRHAERLRYAHSEEHHTALRKILTTDTALLATGNFNQLLTFRMRRSEIKKLIDEGPPPEEPPSTDSMRFSRSSFRPPTDTVGPEKAD